jgi:hypothetical protein
VFAAPNPPSGAVINYFVAQPLGRDVSVTVTDAQGTFRRELAGRGYAGVNQVVWDLRKTPAAQPAERGHSERTPWEDYADGLVEPGEYVVTLTAGAVKVTKTVIVEPEIGPRRPSLTDGQ